MLENMLLQNPKTRAAKRGGAPAVTATAKKAAYIEPTCAVLLAKK